MIKKKEYSGTAIYLFYFILLSDILVNTLVRFTCVHTAANLPTMQDAKIAAPHYINLRMLHSLLLLLSWKITGEIKSLL